MAETDELTSLTAEIVTNFVANNTIAVTEVNDLITAVHTALAALGQAPEPETEEFTPAVTVRKSLSDPSRILSMIDGKPYAMLKRHLARHGLTPAEYRARYNLPANYPLVAPAYSEQRKALAVKIGLGRAPAVEVAPDVAVAPKGRRRLGIVVPADGDAPPAPKARRISRSTKGNTAPAEAPELAAVPIPAESQVE